MTDEAYESLRHATGFDWDAGNAAKIVARHNVQPGECEQAFFREPFVVSVDEQHSRAETRWRALGRTAGERRLFLVFTVRGTLIRVLHARDMSRKERILYAEIQARTAKNPDV